MMKRFLLLAVLAVLAACGKPNNVKTLHHEASVIAHHYQPELDELDNRVQTIFKRGTTIPANLPGIEDVGKRLTEARDGIVQLRGIVGKGPDGKSAVEKQADLAAKERDVEKLTKLIADTERTLHEGTTVIRDDLYSVESWIALYEQGINRPSGPMPTLPTEGGQPPPAPTPTGNPATPPGTTPAAPPAGAAQPAAGQPARPAGAAAGQPARPAGAAAQPAAGQPARPAGGAAQPAGQPARPAGAAQPAPAPPVRPAGAGSAAPAVRP
jgi:hypothetical protein